MYIKINYISCLCSSKIKWLSKGSSNGIERKTWYVKVAVIRLVIELGDINMKKEI